MRGSSSSNLLDVSFQGLTLGEMMALKHALEAYKEVSPVGADVDCYMQNGLDEVGINFDTYIIGQPLKVDRK